MSESETPMSNEVLAVHVDYLREDVQKVLARMSDMATKEDIRNISARMDKFVTTDRFEALEKKVDAGTIGSSFDRFLTTATKLGSAAAALSALGGVIYMVVHFYDKIKVL